jgi:hypothetical protein
VSRLLRPAPLLSVAALLLEAALQCTTWLGLRSAALLAVLAAADVAAVALGGDAVSLVREAGLAVVAKTHTIE